MCGIPRPTNFIVATFTDDIAILAMGGKVEESIQKLYDAVREVGQWIETWLTALCKSAVINCTDKIVRNIHINGNKILHSGTAKYFDIPLNTKLRWNSYIRKRIQKPGTNTINVC